MSDTRAIRRAQAVSETKDCAAAFESEKKEVLCNEPTSHFQHFFSFPPCFEQSRVGAAALFLAARSLPRFLNKRRDLQARVAPPRGRNFSASTLSSGLPGSVEPSRIVFAVASEVRTRLGIRSTVIIPDALCACSLPSSLCHIAFRSAFASFTAAVVSGAKVRADVPDLAASPLFGRPRRRDHRERTG